MSVVLGVWCNVIRSSRKDLTLARHPPSRSLIAMDMEDPIESLLLLKVKTYTYADETHNATTDVVDSDGSNSP